MVSALVSVALAVRWKLLSTIWQEPLVPDAIHYWEIASQMRYPLDTGVSEPMHTILIWPFSTLTSWSTVSSVFTHCCYLWPRPLRFTWSADGF